MRVWARGNRHRGVSRVLCEGGLCARGGGGDVGVGGLCGWVVGLGGNRTDSMTLC